MKTKITFILFSLVISVTFLFAQTDGPYVWRTPDSVIVKAIVHGKLQEDRFANNQIDDHPVSIIFADHPDWNFSVRLRNEIQNENPISAGSSKMIFISDIEGEFENVRNFLLANKIMNKNYQWTFGKNKLIICGDLFDRGKHVTEELWLLYKLEDEARSAGGYVHTILGNHEIMNLSGDVRYVDSAYFRSAAVIGTAYANLYSDSTELGRWLRSKNIVEKIGEHLCLHGGISPAFNRERLPVEQINALARPWYARARDKNADPVTRLLMGAGGPFWYRGYFVAPLATQEQVDSVVHFYACKNLIVGHDIVETITTRYNGKVFGIDVNEHEHHTEGLLVKTKKYYRIDLSGRKKKLQP